MEIRDNYLRSYIPSTSESVLRRTFTWDFVVAEVEYPIIGADFQSVWTPCQIRNVYLKDNITGLTTQGKISKDSKVSVKTIQVEYPYLLRPPGKHTTQHQINRISGPPVYCRPRYLAPDRLKAIKMELQQMMVQGIIHPPKSPGASVLHVIVKKNGWFTTMRWLPQTERPHNSRHVTESALQDSAHKLDVKKVFFIAKAFADVSMIHEFMWYKI